MVTQEYTICTIRNAIPPKVKMSQNDVDSRTIIFTVKDGEGENVDLTGKTVTVKGTRIDGVTFTAACTVDGATATFTENLDMTGAPGDHTAELSITGEGRLGTANFIIAVEAM